MINTKRLTKTFLELVQIDSPSGNEKDIVKYVCSILDNIGVSYTIDTFGNVIAKINGEGEPILLSAHLDTVEPGRGIKPVIVDGVIKSSGDTILGADNKAGVAIILESIQTLMESKVSNHAPLEIVFTVSEEIANLGAVNLDYTQILSKTGFTFDSGSEVGSITKASPYYNRFDIKILGKACHAAHPERGISALNILNSALNIFKFGQIDEETVCNIGVVQGGTVRNTLIGEISLSGEVRSFSEKKLNEITESIKEAFETASKEHKGDISIEVVRENGGFKLDENDPLVITGVAVLNELELSPTFKTSTGCYDANIFFDHGIRTLNFGNGSKNNHTVDESITVEDLNSICKVAYCLISARK